MFSFPLQNLACKGWKYWLGAVPVKQKVITWTNDEPVLCHHTASPGHNELITTRQQAGFYPSTLSGYPFSHRHSTNSFYWPDIIPPKWNDTWWHHGRETLSALLALCEVNPSVIGRFPIQRASNVELWCVFLCQPELYVEQALAWPVTWDDDAHVSFL